MIMGCITWRTVYDLLTSMFEGDVGLLDLCTIEVILRTLMYEGARSFFFFDTIVTYFLLMCLEIVRYVQ